MRNPFKLQPEPVRVQWKPTKCPNCGNTYFSVSHEGPKGEIYWCAINADTLLKIEFKNWLTEHSE